MPSRDAREEKIVALDEQIKTILVKVGLMPVGYKS